MCTAGKHPAGCCAFSRSMRPAIRPPVSAEPGRFDGRESWDAPSAASPYAKRNYLDIDLNGAERSAGVRPCGRALRLHPAQLDPEAGRGQRPHAGNRQRHPARCRCLSGTTVQDHRHGRRGADHPDRCLPGCHQCRRLRAGRGALGRMWLHRHERVGARQRAHRAGRHQGHRPGAGCRLQGRRHHRHARRRPRSARRGPVLLVPGRHGTGRRHAAGSAQAAARLCLRLVADLDLRAAGRRHLHQGR